MKLHWINLGKSGKYYLLECLFVSYFFLEIKALLSGTALPVVLVLSDSGCLWSWRGICNAEDLPRPH